MQSKFDSKPSCVLKIKSLSLWGACSFEISGSCKPELARSDQIPDLRFNISHCTGLVAAVVTLARDVGIDAEFISDSIDHLKIARMHLPRTEVDILEGLHGTHQQDAFFCLWSLRESYLKAISQGLIAEPSNVRFSLNPSQAFSLVPENEALSEWFFWHDKPTHSHILTVAAHRAASEELFCQHKIFTVEELCR
jgi:4'-phosphopantetheinyl transferase